MNHKCLITFYKPLPAACYKTRLYMQGKFLYRVEGVKLYIIFKCWLFYCDIHFLLVGGKLLNDLIPM